MIEGFEELEDKEDQQDIVARTFDAMSRKQKLAYIEKQALQALKSSLEDSDIKVKATAAKAALETVARLNGMLPPELPPDKAYATELTEGLRDVLKLVKEDETDEAEDNESRGPSTPLSFPVRDAERDGDR